MHLSLYDFGAGYSNHFKTVTGFRTCSKTQVFVLPPSRVPKAVNCKARALAKGSVRQGGRTTLVLRVFSFCTTNSHLSKEATDPALGLCPGLSPQLTWGESRRVQHSSRSPRVAYACSSPRHAPLPQGLRPGPVLPLLIATP